MPPRYAYWTIIAGGLPTAFRASEREDLLPTFQRIREKHADAEMKWFARGKLWDSPEAARIRHDDRRDRRPVGEKRGDDRRDRGDGRRTKPQGQPDQEKRGRDWRPGGEHRDPRQKFVDARKQQNAALRKERWERKNAPAREKPHGDPLRRDVRPEPRRQSPRGDWRDRRPADRGAKPEHPWRDRPPRDARTPQGQYDRHARRPSGTGEWRTTEDPQQPPRPRGPDREPRRSETTKPTPPPRPEEPKVPPSGPSERGHIKSRRPFRPRHGPPKGPRR